MGVGLEAGLTIDAMAEELGALIDRADAASLPGDVDELADALAGLGERLLAMRPFIPDKKTALPGNWTAFLKHWRSEKRRVGNACVSTSMSVWALYKKKKKTIT